jgi:FAD/FMN-containing dehydrogenase/Fe-S oxidoreductase
MSLHPDFVNELLNHFSGDIRLDRPSRILYSTDASNYQIEPLGVALPKTQEDLQVAVELAVKYRVPILPRGSGSSLAGQAIGEALILDCSRWLDNLVAIDPEARTATVEPGLVLSRLNAAAAKHGLTFGPDPASAERATMGGVIGNNATGAHSILYGMSADHLISVDVIQGDGSLATWGEEELSAIRLQPSAVLSAALEIREHYASAIKGNYPRSWRNSAGYRLNYLLPWSPAVPQQWSDEWSRTPGYYPPVRRDSINLAPLLAGSEGTLAVIRRATVNLVPRPAHTILGVLAYDSIAAACDDVPRLLQFNPSAVELIPQLLVRLAKGVPAYAGLVSWVPGDPAALLVVEFSGSSPEVLKDAARSLGPDVILAETPSDQAKVWGVRKVGLGIFNSRPADARPLAMIEDCAIPVERLGEFVREVEKTLAAHGTYAAMYAHASAGCLHIRPIVDLKSGEGRQSLRAITEATFALTLRLGGAMSSEHGDGIARAEFLQQTYGPQVTEAMRILKRAADPLNLLNPGKMLDAPPLDTNLRYGEGYRTRPWTPVLDFRRNNGLAGAIEQCNGQGVCRKDSGVMCPSFQATREEMHSTRGRANLLRAMIMSPSPLESPMGVLRKGARGEGENAVFGALDLCLACKGCKAECPSGVDMAKLKYEFQHEYYKSHRRKLRDYVFAYIGPLAQIGAPFARLANWVMENGFIKKALQLAPNREFPQFVSRSQKPESRLTISEYRETIFLLRDTFTHFFEPHIEQAALDVLAACRVRVFILPYFGAGRTLISKGFIKPARRHAERLLDAIRKLDPEGRLPVLGIEPSELYTLRDEFLDLLPERQAEVASLASRAWLVDEFLVRPGIDGESPILRITKLLRENSVKVSLHGHCYQKAQPPVADGFPVGQFASAELLKAAGYEVEIIPSGCCGMAGAFGYEAEHYEVSMQVGELVLLPAVRQAWESGQGIAAVGTSCRSQIADGTNVNAQHPIVLVANRLYSEFPQFSRRYDSSQM